MRLPKASCRNTCESLLRKFFRKSYATWQPGEHPLQVESLEARQMLAGFGSSPTEIIETVDAPKLALIAPLNEDPHPDLLTVNAASQITLALNGGDDTWIERREIDLNIGPVYGLATGLIDGDLFPDLLLQTADALLVASNDGTAGFTITQTLTPRAPGDLAPLTADTVDLVVTDINGDFFVDIVAVAPRSGDVIIYKGDASGSFGAPIVLSSGAVEPTTLVVSNLIRDGNPDVGVGHRDGTLSLIQQNTNGSFLLRPTLAVATGSPINALDAADLDTDGDVDIIVTQDTAVTLWANNNDTIPTSPIVNGGFDTGLSGWTVDVSGHADRFGAGSVSAQSGIAQLLENESFLVTLSQTFAIPFSPQAIQVDLVGTLLDQPTSGLPDAFEISLLGSDGSSLLPSFRTGATSLFNLNPGNAVSLARGVTFDGTTVTIDISGIAPTTQATLYFDLIGNPPESGSLVSIDNVRITPEAVFDSRFTEFALPGSHVQAVDSLIADVDGDSLLDVVSVDEAIGRVVVYNGSTSGIFARFDTDVTSYGSAPRALAAGRLTSGDTVVDVAIVLEGSDLVLSPLVADRQGALPAFIDPQGGQTVADPLTQLVVQFSEAVQDHGPAGLHSVTNPAAFELRYFGADQISGGGDDVFISIASVQYDLPTRTATILVAAGAQPLPDGRYGFSVMGADPLYSILDLSQNPLGNGVDVGIEFVLNASGPQLQALFPVVGDEGQQIDLNGSFSDLGSTGGHTASVDWGDGTQSAAIITFSNGQGDLFAQHRYSDNGSYTVRVSVVDSAGGQSTRTTTAEISNVAPQVTVAANQTVTQGDLLDIIVASWSDPGFTAGGTSETFSALIDWGDGTLEPGAVTVTNGSAGVRTVGMVAGQHIYVDPGSFVVTVTVSDDDNAVTTGTFDVDVTSSAPAVQPIAPLTGSEGAIISLATQFIDGITSESYQVVIAWGDGSQSTLAVDTVFGHGAVNADHVYPDNGLYSIQVTVTDPDQHSGSAQTVATVQNVAPLLTLAGNQHVDSGEPLELQVVSFEDPGFDNPLQGTAESFSVTVDWGDGNAEAVVPDVAIGGLGTPTTGVVLTDHIYQAPGTYTVHVTVSDDDQGTSEGSFFVVVNEGAGLWLPSIDFESDAFGNPLRAGELIAEQWAEWGVHISTHDPLLHPAMVFDSSNPSGEDWDLGTPNESVGGPGWGGGGVAGQPGANQQALQNVLIISEDADSNDPDDRATGGTLIFTFDQAVMLDELRFLDLDEGSESAVINLFDAQGELILSKTVSGLGNNSVQTVLTLSAGVRRMEILLAGSGALTDIIFCRQAVPSAKDMAQFFVVNDQHHRRDAYFYSADGRWVDRMALNGVRPRGAAARSEGSTLWVVGADERVYLFDPTSAQFLGSWRAKGVRRAEGITTDGSGIWIVDDFRNRVYFYAGEAQRSDGHAWYTSWIKLHKYNRHPSGLTTDGQYLWVTDRVADSVFVYSVTGRYQGRWQLDRRNGYATGITLNPNGASGLWVVDRQDDKVYYYEAGKEWRSGRHYATSKFQLEASNRNPEGIADPTDFINLGDVVSDGIAVPGEVDDWLFDAASGQSIYIDWQANGGGVTEYSLFDPLGNEIASNDGNSPTQLDLGPISLPSDGTFRLSVRGRSTAVTTYTFQLHDVPDGQQQFINFGDTVSGSISVPGQRDLWQFAAADGQQAYFDFHQLSGGVLEIELLDPNGVRVFSDNGSNTTALDHGATALPFSGIYTFVVKGRGDATPSYEFRLWDVPPNVPRPISLDTLISDIRVPGQFFTYTFVASAGAQLAFDVQANAGNQLKFTLTAPSGTAVFAGVTVDQLLAPLVETGTYTLSIAPVNSNDPDLVAPFAFRMQSIVTPALGTRDSQGTEFLVAFPRAEHDSAVTLQLFITSAVDTTATVTIDSMNFVHGVDVRAGEMTVVTLPTQIELSATTDLIEDKAIRVTSHEEITVYGLSQESDSTDAFLALPVDALGTDYVILGYENTGSGTLGTTRGSLFAVIASEDNTNVTVTPAVTAGSRPAQIPFVVTLQRGQVYHLLTSLDPPADLSGTIVTADKPIAVFGGNRCTFIPTNSNACDYLIEQLPSTDTWGSYFVTAPLALRQNGDTFRIAAAQDGTTVSINGLTVATLDRGEFIERILSGPNEISANRPILVAQYANSLEYDSILGDPFMMLVAPVGQFQTDYTLVSLDDVSFQSQHINLIVPDAAVPSVTVDSILIDPIQFSPIGTSGFQFAQISVAAGGHTVSASQPFGVSVYGFDQYDSYGYVGGAALGPLAQVTQVTATPSSAFAGLNTVFEVTAFVTDASGMPLEGVRVDFRSTGANPVSGSAVSDQNGVATFSYTGTAAGTDTIVAFVENVFDTVSVVWLATPPIVTIASPIDGAEFHAGTSVLLSGRAVAGDQFAEIVAVTVNGSSVAAVDASGNFFALVPLTLGQNLFDVIATDSNGVTSSVQLELVGVTPVSSADIDAFGSVPGGLFRFEYVGTTFNRQLDQLLVDARVTNTGSDTIPHSSLAVFHTFHPVSTDVVNSDGYANGRPYLVLDDEVPATGLEANQVSQVLPLVLGNPNRERFRFQSDILRPDNQPPRFTSTPKTIVAAGSPYEYIALATDRDGENLRFSLLVSPSSMTMDPLTGRVIWGPTVSETGVHDVQIAVHDGNGAQTVQAFALQVTDQSPPNRPPLIVSAPALLLNVFGSAAVDYFYDVVAIDFESQSVTFSLLNAPAGMAIDALSGRISWTAGSSELGTHAVAVQAADSDGGVSVQDFQIEVIDVPPARIEGTVFEDLNLNGVFDLGEPGLAGQSIFLDANVNGFLDGNEAIVVSNAQGSYAFDGRLPGPHPVSWLPATGFTTTSASRFDINLAAGQIVTGVDFAVVSTGGSGNVAPLISSSPPQSAKVGLPYEYQIRASDPDGDILAFTLLNAPDGMVVDQGTGLLSWTPTAEQLNVQSALLQVDDGQGHSVLQSFTVLVRPALRPPVIRSSPGRIATAGASYVYDVFAEDADSTDLIFSLFTAPASMSIDAASGSVSWTPTATDVGNHAVSIVVTDELGFKAIQSFDLEVRHVNVAPRFLTEPILQAVAQVPYEYNVFAADGEDEVTFSLLTSPTGMSIDQRVGRLVWIPDAADVGSHDVIIRATDERGLLSDQAFTLTVVPDTFGPVVSISMSGTVRLPGESVQIQVVARDNVGLATVELFVDGIPLQLDANDSAVFTPVVPGLVSVTARAVDVNGNVGANVRTLRVVDPADLTAPFVEITNPAIDGRITYVTDIVGSVVATDLESFQLQYSLRGLANWVTFAEGTSEIIDGVLGTLDPTLLANDLYDIRLLAQDFSGNVGITEIFVSVEGQAKLGNFRLELTDLQIPLAGIPITITRVYDSLDAAFSQDFGYGWHLSVGTARLRESVRLTAAEQAGVPSMFGGNAFRVGTRVYLNTPDGRRVGFTFAPTAEGGFLGTIWRPNFVADPGVHEQLTVGDVALSQNADGTFGTYLTGFAFNPQRYTLITKDQTRYVYDQFDELLSMTNRNNVTLEYRANGIFSSTGQSIQWVRDQRGRITEIVDPAGHSIHYGYDGAGNLVSVTDQVGNVTRVTYHGDRAHIVNEIIGPGGNLVSRTEYDDDGRVAAIVDAEGNPITQVYDLLANTEIIGDRLGNETTLVFDNRGNVTSLINALGERIDTTYDADDNETSITDPRGLTTIYQYDARGNLTRLTRADGSQLTTTFNEFNDPLTITNPDGTTVQLAYDQKGNQVEFVNAAGVRELMGVDAFGRVITHTDGDGRVTQFQYGDFAEPTSITFADGTSRSNQTNALGEFTLITDELGNQTQFFFDEAGRPLESIDPLVGKRSFSYAGELLQSSTDALGRVTSFEYDQLDRLVKIIDALGGETTRTYDANSRLITQTDTLGRTQRWTYRADGLTGSFTDAMGNLTTFGYDDSGNQTSVTNARGFVWTFGYDDLDRLIERVDPLGGREQFVYDSRDNLLVWSDENGGTTRFGYDPVNRLTSVTDPIGNVESWTHDVTGNVVAYIDGRSFQTNYQYDALNRLTQVTDAAGFVQSFDYDALGQQIRSTDQLGNSTQYIYDAGRRLTEIIDPAGGRTLFEYDLEGNSIRTIDPLGRATTNEYDALNRRVSTTNALGATILFDYDAASNPTRVTDSIGNVTAYAYDLLDRVTLRTDPLGNSEQFGYDEVSNLTNHVNRNGLAREFDFDPLNRITEERWLDSLGGVATTISFSYDAAGNLVQAASPGSQFAFAYDGLDRIVSATSDIGSLSPHLLSYQYDAAGNTLLISDNQGVAVASSYDGRNLLLSRDWSGASVGPARLEFSYGERGLRQSVSRFTDLLATNLVSQSSFSFDSVGRPSSILHVDSAGSDVARYTLQFDAADQLIQQTTNGATSSYQYDSAGQLIGALNDVGPDEAYAFDLEGNRAAAAIVTGPGNRLLSDGSFDYQYDAEGNLLAKTSAATGEVTEFQYDHRNRLVSATRRSPGGIILEEVGFSYDVFDRRIAKTVDIDGDGPLSPQTLYTFYDGQNAWVDVDGQGNDVARYLFGDEVDQLLARWRPGEGTAWYLTDHLGSVRDVVDASGQLINHMEYDSFGNLLVETNPADGDRFKFTGREWDAELGLYYYRARYYDPQTGRFISQDPIGFNSGDTNSYRYVGNAPLTFVDPSGLAGLFTYSTLAKQGPAIASGVVGFGVGYACGYWEATAQGLEGGAAHAVATEQAVIGAAVSGAVGLATSSVGGAGTGAGIFLTGVFTGAGLGLGLINIANSENAQIATIRVVCFAADIVTGAATSRLTSKFINSRALRRYSLDESGRIHGRAGSVEQRVQALLDGAPGVNITARVDGVDYRLNVSGGRKGAGTAVTDFKAVEDVIGPLPAGNRMVIRPELAARLEQSLGLPTGRLRQGGIITVVFDVAARAPRSPLTGNDLFLGGSRGLPGSGPEINVAPINNAGGGGTRQIILEVQ